MPSSAFEKRGMRAYPVMILRVSSGYVRSLLTDARIRIDDELLPRHAHLHRSDVR